VREDRRAEKRVVSLTGCLECPKVGALGLFRLPEIEELDSARAAASTRRATPFVSPRSVVPSAACSMTACTRFAGATLQYRRRWASVTIA
jgi:hypothetical protein